MDDSAALQEVVRTRHVLDYAVTSEKLARTELEAAMIGAAEAGASQREIAALASVSQPYVHRVLTERKHRFVPRSRLGVLLVAHRDDVAKILQRHGIGNVAVFGSVARGEDRPDSDVDLLVDIPPHMGLFGLARAEQELRGILGIDVDLVPRRLLKPGVRDTTAAETVPL
jgi:predicted nucleotidyltransferase